MFVIEIKLCKIIPPLSICNQKNENKRTHEKNKTFSIFIKRTINGSTNNQQKQSKKKTDMRKISKKPIKARGQKTSQSIFKASSCVKHEE